MHMLMNKLKQNIIHPTPYALNLERSSKFCKLHIILIKINNSKKSVFAVVITELYLYLQIEFAII